jgi:hypothetical protein
MVAPNHDYRPFDTAKALFSEDVLAEIVDLRAHGKSWEETAQAVEWDANELRKAVKCDPNFAPALERARCEVADETNDEGLARLRKLTGDDNPEIALEAHRIIRKYLAEQERNKTRLAVEGMRLQAQMTRAEVQRAKSREQEEVDEDAPRVDPVDGGPMCSIREEREMKEAKRQVQEIIIEEVADAGATVWLWAGDHRVHAHKPGPNDTPLQIIPTIDSYVAGKRIFWAVPLPEPAHIMGPYLRPEECKRVPPLEEEVYKRILRRFKGEADGPANAGAGAAEQPAAN